MSAACCDILTRVVQDGNGIGERGAAMIGEGLKVNCSLERLHLVSCLSDCFWLFCVW